MEKKDLIKIYKSCIELTDKDIQMVKSCNIHIIHFKSVSPDGNDFNFDHPPLWMEPEDHKDMEEADRKIRAILEDLLQKRKDGWLALLAKAEAE